MWSVFDTSQQAPIATDVPLGVIAKFDVQERKGARQVWKLTCRDIRTVHFTLPEKAPRIARLLSKYNTAGEVGTLFAAAHFKAPDDGWKIYQVRERRIVCVCVLVCLCMVS